jgi:putative ABC transport system ATP-binding protein
VSTLRLESLQLLGGTPFGLQVGDAECVAVSGPSGSGKTLLLRAIADLDPHSGRLWLNGQDYLSLLAPLWRRRVGLLPAESRWWSERARHDFGELAPGGLERLELGSDVLDRPLTQLSSGERQRLGLLRLLANRPDVLLLDEPTAHLDRTSTSSVEGLLRDYREENRAAVLWVSHDTDQTRRVASRCIWLRNGTIEREEVL